MADMSARDCDLLAIGMALNSIEYEEWLDTDEKRQQVLREGYEFLGRLREVGYAVVRMVG